ncbi:MAG: adenosine deaminase, partial [Ignavibacteria bacterium]|nr:adenosine deaminase [Ignavibacteria bacterium]
GAVPSLEEHPFGLLHRYRFRVTLNTDDRLMSNTTMTQEFRVAHQVFRLSLEDLEKVTINAMKSAFIPYNRRLALIYDVIKPGYAKGRQKMKRTRS